jgi:hypothetical protein
MPQPGYRKPHNDLAGVGVCNSTGAAHRFRMHIAPLVLEARIQVTTENSVWLVEPGRYIRLPRMEQPRDPHWSASLADGVWLDMTAAQFHRGYETGGLYLRVFSVAPVDGRDIHRPNPGVTDHLRGAGGQRHRADSVGGGRRPWTRRHARGRKSLGPACRVAGRDPARRRQHGA